MNQCYVYTYLDPRKSGHYSYSTVSFLYEPFYIGKGTRRRDTSHLKHCLTKQDRLPFHDKLRKLMGLGNIPFILRLQSGLASHDALKIEKQLVEEIGRKDLDRGPLMNCRDGGEGFGTVSESTRTKMRDSHLGKIPANKGKKGQIPWNTGLRTDPVVVEKMRQTKIQRFQTGQITVWNKGQRGITKFGPPSVEKRNKIRIAKQVKWSVTAPNGDIKLVSDLKMYCKENHLTYANMCAVGRGVRKHHKYYTCRRSNEVTNRN